MDSPFAREVVYRADYSDVERWIKAEYGHEYDIVAQEELSNNSSWSGIVSDGEQKQWEKDELNAFKLTGRSTYLEHILNDMCAGGVISPGDYIIDVCW
jgi:hypothetical protein